MPTDTAKIEKLLKTTTLPEQRKSEIVEMVVAADLCEEKGMYFAAERLRNSAYNQLKNAAERDAAERRMNHAVAIASFDPIRGVTFVNSWGRDWANM